MQRLGFAIKLKPECMADYKRVHAKIWPGVLAKIRDCNIANYSIFLHEPDCLMFGYPNIAATTTMPIWRAWPKTGRHKTGGICASP